MPVITIVIPGSIVSKKNGQVAVTVGGVHKPRRSIIVPKAAYQRWEKNSRKWFMLYYARTVSPFLFPCHVTALFYYKGPRPDIAGSFESISDCLQGFLWMNDRQIDSWDGSRLNHDLKNPRTELTVRW